MTKLTADVIAEQERETLAAYEDAAEKARKMVKRCALADDLAGAREAAEEAGRLAQLAAIAKSQAAKVEGGRHG